VDHVKTIVYLVFQCRYPENIAHTVHGVNYDKYRLCERLFYTVVFYWKDYSGHSF